MTARAYIEVLPPYDRIAIHAGDGYADGSTVVLRFGDVVMERLEEPAPVNTDAEPLRLKEEHARAIYEALAKHFGGGRRTSKPCGVTTTPNASAWTG